MIWASTREMTDWFSQSWLWHWCMPSSHMEWYWCCKSLRSFLFCVVQWRQVLFWKCYSSTAVWVFIALNSEQYCKFMLSKKMGTKGSNVINYCYFFFLFISWSNINLQSPVRCYDIMVNNKYALTLHQSAKKWYPTFDSLWHPLGMLDCKSNWPIM